MRFALSDEQRQFGAALHELLCDADVPAAARAWATGDRGPGLAIWRQLAGAGVSGLAVPETLGGLGAHPVELVVACEELGHHPLPGPAAESLAAVPQLLGSLPGDIAGGWLAGLVSGELVATLAAPPSLPFALDADAAGLVLLAGRATAPTGEPLSAPAGSDPDAATIWQALPGDGHRSADRARHPFEVRPGPVLASGSGAADAVRLAMSYGTLASAALLAGAGRGLLDLTVRHARTRLQFGRPIGAFQAVKHALANVAIGLEFARPLIYAAAIALHDDAATAARDISAARVASADAARRAARTALQVHGGIGYTLECDVSLWLAKVRALSSAWGSQAEHRATVLAALTAPAADHQRTGPWS
jgi:alkylation response protein AidB-like acyl-CoA dehydrogenase